MLIALTVLVIAAEASGEPVLKVWGGGLCVAYIACVIKDVRWSRRAFVAIGIALSAFAVLSRTDGWTLVADALAAGGFVIAFFLALSTLRTAAGTSASIRRCGEYLATRTPSKRYLALAFGGHLFALMLNYGSISLLGTLVEQAETEADGRPRNAVKVRRMLLAIQRGFAATLCWSPLSLSMAIGPAVIVGSSWGGVVGYGVLTSLLVVLLGWGVDAAFKPPRPANAPPPSPPVGSPRTLVPLLMLLAALVVCVSALMAATGLRVVIAVMAMVPLISLSWIALQTARPETPESRAPSVSAEVLRRIRDYLGRELDAYKSEIVLLFMAGFIGKIAGELAHRLVTAHFLDLSVVPGWAILVALVCSLPALGMLGMNPILSGSLIGPLLPDPATVGLSPDITLLAMAFGWSLTAVTSPFTATVLLIALFGRVSPLTVGLRWNGLFLAAGCMLGIVWLLLLATLTG